MLRPPPATLKAPPIEFDANGVMKWERVKPPLWWPAAQRHIVADRCLPDGNRQHMVEGRVERGLVIANAQVIGEQDTPDAEFAAWPSHLSLETDPNNPTPAWC